MDSFRDLVRVQMENLLVGAYGDSFFPALKGLYYLESLESWKATGELKPTAAAMYSAPMKCEFRVAGQDSVVSASYHFGFRKAPVEADFTQWRHLTYGRRAVIQAFQQMNSLREKDIFELFTIQVLARSGGAPLQVDVILNEFCLPDVGEAWLTI